MYYFKKYANYIRKDIILYLPEGSSRHNRREKQIMFANMARTRYLCPRLADRKPRGAEAHGAEAEMIPSNLIGIMPA